MNSDAANALADGLARFGAPMTRDARQCRSVLSDLVPHRKREIRVLATAVEEGAPAELLARGASTPETLVVESLAKRLHNNHGIDIELSRWAVQAWASALKRTKLAAAPSSGPASSTSAPPKKSSSSSQGAVVRVLIVLGLVLMVMVGAGAWMVVRLLNQPESKDQRSTVIADGSKATTPDPKPRPLDHRPAVQAPNPAGETTTPTGPVSEPRKSAPIVPPVAPRPTSKPEIKPETKPETKPEAKPEIRPDIRPPVIEIDPTLAWRGTLVKKAAEVDRVRQPVEARAAMLRERLRAIQADIKERRKLLSYLERGYQRATDEQRWPMRVSGFVYSQPNAKRAIEAVGAHIEKQEGAASELESLIQKLGAQAVEGGLVVGDLECLAGARTGAGCAALELTKVNMETLMRRADEFVARVGASPKADPPMSTLDLSAIPQP